MLFNDKIYFLVKGKCSQHVGWLTGEPIRELCMINLWIILPDRCFGVFSAPTELDHCFPVEGMINAEKCKWVVEKKVVVDLANAFLDGSGVFQQELTPCHKTKKWWITLNIKILVLDLPGNSADLNLTKNLWSLIKLWLRSDDCTTKIRFIKVLIWMW